MEYIIKHKNDSPRTRRAMSETPKQIGWSDVFINYVDPIWHCWLRIVIFERLTTV